MKKLLLILLCLTTILNSCSTKKNRVSFQQLYKEGDKLFFDGSPFNGIGYSLYRNNQLEVEAQFRNGKADGYYKKWTKSGLLKIEGRNKDGMKSGTEREWRSTDEGKRYLYYEKNYLEDKLHGQSRSWYHGGELQSTIFNYKLGVKHGVQKRWHFDGKFDYEHNYIDGKLITE